MIYYLLPYALLIPTESSMEEAQEVSQDDSWLGQYLMSEILIIIT